MVQLTEPQPGQVQREGQMRAEILVGSGVPSGKSRHLMFGALQNLGLWLHTLVPKATLSAWGSSCRVRAHMLWCGLVGSLQMRGAGMAHTRTGRSNHF